jgi:hypothetical protein
VVFEEKLVCDRDPLADILNGLGSDRRPELTSFPKFSNMSLKFGTIQMLFEHPVVPFMQRNAMVIDYS